MNRNRRQVIRLSGAGMLALGTFAALSYGGSVSPAHAVTMDEIMSPQALPDMSMGKDDAPVTIVEYASMTCPHCARVAVQTMPEIKKKYIDTGKVRLIFREFPLDPRAQAAAMLARCAPKERFFPLVDVLFKQQNVWAVADDPRPPLLQIAKLAGFTQESFEACLKNQQVLDSVLAVRSKGESYGVNGTPTFFINGEMYSGEMSVEEMSKLIDKFL